jgi:hypothetical protein
LSGETILLASRKFILLSLDNIKHIEEIGCSIGADVGKS